MALTPDQIDDFVNLTLPHFKRRSWTDISLDLQFYCSSKMIDPKRIRERGGSKINFKLQVRNTGNVKYTGMYAVDETKVEDVTDEAEVPWTKITGNFSYDIDEDLFQSSEETIIRELQIREHDMMNSFYERMEQALWSAPTGPSQKVPYGIPYWLVKAPTSGADVNEGGFDGSVPNGFTTVAGLDPSTYPRWRNYAFGYEAISRDDLVRKLKKAIRFTQFEPPHPHPELGFGATNYEIFTTERVVEPLERLAETRNDNLGSDVAKYMNQVTVAGVPIRWVPYLHNNDTSDPLYGINWAVWRPFVKTGCDMRRSPVTPAPNQHTVRRVHTDHWHNYTCYNRRRCFVGSLAT